MFIFLCEERCDAKLHPHCDITDKQDVYIFPESTAPQDYGTFVHILIFVSIAIPVP